MDKNRKKERFARLANKWTSKALRYIKHIETLSDKRFNEYTNSEVLQIMKALKKAVKKCEASFRDENGEKKFSLK